MACQLELFALLDPAQRANVTFLGEVVLNKSKLSISKDVLTEITSVRTVTSVGVVTFFELLCCSFLMC